MRRILVIILLVFACFPVLAQKAPPAKPWERLDGCTLIENRWNDGDSFHVRHGSEEFIFRLYFIDTPEADDSFPERLAEQGAYFGKDAFKSANKRVLRFWRFCGKPRSRYGLDGGTRVAGAISSDSTRL